MGNLIRKENLVHWLFVAAYLVSAVLTVLPWEAASKECRLGYKALCSFTPYGTLILIALLALHVVLAVGKSRRKSR